MNIFQLDDTYIEQNTTNIDDNIILANINLIIKH